ncbi:hypothetical protein CRG98_012104 [Punica granatum]|uniref:Uncharacterized protein n=1 Tax=Punica granatum TaxID=22663 RepID=A0A2I0KGT8_PUNGR|nr:hypothetical protein CRG98_012104 [Punica granatum]
MTDPIGAKQTQLAPDKQTDLQEALGGLLMQVDRFCRLFMPLRVVLLVSVCFALWAKWLTRRPRLKIDKRRRPRNPKTGLSQCFPSVLMCSEIVVISVCYKRVPMVCREAFVTIETSLGRPFMYSVGPTVNSDPSFGRVFSYRTSKAVVMVTVGVLFWSRRKLRKCMYLEHKKVGLWTRSSKKVGFGPGAVKGGLMDPEQKKGGLMDSKQ